VNVLLVLYHNFQCNSANHVDGIARVLCNLGCDCIVAVPNEPIHAELMDKPPYKAATFQQVLDGRVKFANGSGAQVAHFWTPREVNRHFWKRLRDRGRFATIIHMEDNEELISRSQLGADYDAWVKEPRRGEFPPHLSHPRYWMEFLQAADGLTVIIDALREIIPKDKPTELIWPSTDERSFHPRASDAGLRRELGIDRGQTVLAYHGNVHSANFREVRSLYLATALLNREGRPTTLLRMGRDHLELDADYRRWADQYASAVGFVPSRDRLAQILSEADMFVQPGLCDAFNEYRFPSKVPDFLALGKPLILPRTNIGLVTRHGEDAFVLEEATGTAIADAVKTILDDQPLRQRLSEGARRFFESNLGWPSTAVKLLDLYYRIINPPAEIDTSKPSDEKAMNLTKRYAQAKFPAISYATVRDYSDSADHLRFLCTMNDLKDVQRPWTAKAILGELRPGGKLLELGGGESIVGSFLHTLGWQVTLCDVEKPTENAAPQTERIRLRGSGVKLLQSRFDLPAAQAIGGQMEGVYSITVMERKSAAELEEIFAAIATALRPGGISVHCIDAVVQGNGDGYYMEQAARILQLQNRLAGQETPFDACMQTVRDLFATALKDVETFFLGPQGHNKWRGQMEYEKFPFRRCISVQFLCHKPG
jgi:glycosyltransferase involved in cell wall biosynthesis